MKTVKVDVSKSYDIIIGNGILDDIGDYLKNTARRALAAIVTDDIVDALYGKRLETALEKHGFRTIKYTLPHGEESKNADNFVSIINFLADNGFSRAGTVFALGGGVVGDIAGFAAASYMRGVGLVQIPTTLLAAVDSSVGGKTGIDLKAGKNLAGAFYQPDLVLCDHSLMSTLTPEIFRDGCAEVIKYGVIADNELFERLKNPVSELLEDIITRCVEIKRDIVRADEREEGVRKLLNFGHTVGHAIEKLSHYRVSHGHAVAAGMAVIARASAKQGFCSFECRDKIIGMIRSYGLETSAGFGTDELWQACLSDKKRSGGMISIVIPERIGSCRILDITFEELRGFISLGAEGRGQT